MNGIPDYQKSESAQNVNQPIGIEKKIAHAEAVKKFRKNHPDYDKIRYHKIKDVLREKQKEFRERPERKEYYKNWCQSNKEKVKNIKRKYRETCEHYNEKQKITQAKWKEKNRDKYLAYRKKQYHRRKDSITYKLNRSMRGMMWYSLNGRKNISWKKCVDYTVDDLRHQREKQFKPGMAWKNYGRGGWEIDHKIPIAAHNITTKSDYDFKRCWSLGNLVPLWGKENQAKRDRLHNPFQPSLL